MHNGEIWKIRVRHGQTPVNETELAITRDTNQRQPNHHTAASGVARSDFRQPSSEVEICVRKDNYLACSEARRCQSHTERSPQLRPSKPGDQVAKFVTKALIEMGARQGTLSSRQIFAQAKGKPDRVSDPYSWQGGSGGRHGGRNSLGRGL